MTGVVELFTSQGCSSCPPADEVLGKLARQPNLIAISLPVDYWDRLGWKDTFGSPLFSARQRAYAGARGDGEVYTPQAVVNGAAHVNGSDRDAIQDALNSQTWSGVPIDVRGEGEHLIVTVGSLATPSPKARVLVLPTLDKRQVAIGRGENAHRSITYTNIVRRIDSVASWSGKAVTAKVPRSQFAGYEGVVVLLQSGTDASPGAILGAAMIDLD